MNFTQTRISSMKEEELEKRIADMERTGWTVIQKGVISTEKVYFSETKYWARLKRGAR